MPSWTEAPATRMVPVTTPAFTTWQEGRVRLLGGSSVVPETCSSEAHSGRPPTAPGAAGLTSRDVCEASALFGPPGSQPRARLPLQEWGEGVLSLRTENPKTTLGFRPSWTQGLALIGKRGATWRTGRTSGLPPAPAWRPVSGPEAAPPVPTA